LWKLIFKETEDDLNVFYETAKEKALSAININKKEDKNWANEEFNSDDGGLDEAQEQQIGGGAMSDSSKAIKTETSFSSVVFEPNHAILIEGISKDNEMIKPLSAKEVVVSKLCLSLQDSNWQ
jgi:hypothetical protein